MFYALNSDTYVRNYENITIVTRPAIEKEKVVDEIGGMFLQQLSYEYTSTDEILDGLLKEFNVDRETLLYDVIEFYEKLVADGYIIRGGSTQKLSAKERLGHDASFNYKNNLVASKDSIAFLNKYFLDSPHLLNFQIELTDKCNERCVHCYIPHEYKKNELRKDDVLDIIDQCRDMNVLTISFSGGEPMLHPFCSDFIRYAKDYDINVTIFSNLTMLSDSILEALKYKHPSVVRVSLYSMNPDTHDSITLLSGSFEKTTKNIIKLVQNGITVIINCPILQQNKHEFDAVIQWGNEHGCKVVTDYMIMAKSDGNTENLNCRIDSSDMTAVLSKLLDYNLKQNSSILKYEKAIKNLSDERVCGVGITTLSLSATGKVFPCAGWSNCVCGDIKKETLKDIWNKSGKIKFLRSIRMKDFEKCNNCEDYDFCSLCLARNSNEDPNGDIFNISPITCDAAKTYHLLVIQHQDKKG